MKRLLSFVNNIIIHYKSCRDKLSSVIEQKKECLACGTYKVDSSLTLIYNRKSKSEAKKQSKFIYLAQCKKLHVYEVCLSVKIAERVLSIFYRKKILCDGSICIGQLLLIDNRSIKIFDYKNAIVYTFFNDLSFLIAFLMSCITSSWRDSGASIPIDTPFEAT